MASGEGEFVLGFIREAGLVRFVWLRFFGLCLIVAWSGLGMACGQTPPGAASPASQPVENDRTGKLQRIFDDYWDAYLRRNPTRATYIGDHRYDDALDDYSEKALHQWIDQLHGFLVRLQEIGLQGLSPPDQLNARLFLRVLRDEIRSNRYPAHLMPFTQQDGPQITLPLLQDSHRFRNLRDYEIYAARLSAFGKQVDDVIAVMREGLRRQIVMPAVIAEKTLPQFDVHVVKDPKDSVMYGPVKRFPEAMSESERETAANLVAQAIEKSVTPGFKRLAEFMRNEYLPHCRSDPGWWSLPDGEAWYDELVEHHVTTEMSPAVIHQIGLKEMERIRSEMTELMKKLGGEGTLPEFIAKLRGDPAMCFSSAAAMMTEYEQVVREAEKQLPKLFGRLPKAPCGLKEMEGFRRESAPMAYYYAPPEDGSRPGYFYVNTLDPTHRPKYTMQALAYHEAVPGHHLQITLAQENRDIPAFRRYTGFTVFVEGWGLYSESLGEALGGYRDPYQQFGRLTFDAWRASRLVVDTGIHAMRWTRQQAIDYLEENTALSERNIASEVDRYIAWPGQACAYKIGQLAIVELRRQAEEQLGDRFDVRAFHDELLGQGALPLDILRERLRAWMAGASTPGGTAVGAGDTSP